MAKSRIGPLLLLWMVGCSEQPGDKDSCADVQCQPWQQCSMGACVVGMGRCEQRQHCATNMECDGAEHLCKGPTRPLDGWVDRVSGDRLAFQYQGRINAKEDLDTTRMVLGVGRADYSIGSERDALLEYPVVYREKSTPQESTAVLHGMVSKRLDADLGTTRRMVLELTVPVGALVAARDARTAEFAAPQGLDAQLKEQLTRYRTWDGARLTRTCTRTIPESTTTDSAIFTSLYPNSNYNAGDEVKLWIRLHMGAWQAISPGNEEALCSYALNGESVDRDRYEKELAQTSPTLACAIPDGFLASSLPSHATVVFSGTINSSETSAVTLGRTKIDVLLRGTPVVVDDGGAYVMEYNQGGQGGLWLMGNGGVRNLSNTHWAFNTIKLSASRTVLEKMKREGTTTTPVSAMDISVTVEAAEQKATGNNTYAYKACPLAVFDFLGELPTLLACVEQNASFSPGETLDMALNVGLLTDEESLAQYYGSSGMLPCYCQDGLSPELMDCTRFDEL